jgi:uncharacterized membrane protein
MTLPIYIFLLALAIGFVCGLRSLTSPAVTAWAAHLGWLRLAGTPLSFMGSIYTLIFFTLFAAVELITDKLPKTPSRTAPPGLIARFLTGALCGASLGAGSSASLLACALLGSAGAMIGAFAGFQARTRAGKALGAPDLVIAISEDLITILGALLIVTRA